MQAHWRALALLTLARTSLGFQFQSVASVSPLLVEEIGISYTDLGSLIGLYFAPGMVIALPGGVLGRRFGDKRVVAFGLLLMALGGVVCGLAEGFLGLAVGRVIAGIGGVLLNVVMAKMVTDWFAGRREIVLAMAIFVNSLPIGIGLAMLSLGPLAAVAGSATALGATAAVAMAALALLALGYTRHPNDAVGVVVSGGAISAAEFRLVCIAGAIWGIFNGSFATMMGFAPTLLMREGMSLAEAGLIVGISTWLVVASVLVGGLLAQGWERPVTLVGIGAIAWAACLLLLTTGNGWGAAALLGAGLVFGLPVGVFMSLPAQVLQPESRSLGMGIFYTWLYVGFAVIPPTAGWLQDKTGSAGAPMYFAAALVLGMVPLHAVFRAGFAKHLRTTAA